MSKRLKVAGAVSYDGKSYKPDKAGVVEVPDEAAQVLIESHGAQLVGEAAKAPADPPQQ